MPAASTTAQHSPAATRDTLAHRLAAIGQSHVLRFHDELPEPARRSLLAQIAALDLDRVPVLIEQYVKNKPAFALPPDVQPAPYYPADGQSAARPWNASTFRRAGEDLLRAGHVAAFTVAGGQGSRLGFEGPKGCFPAGAITGKPLFQFFADGLLGAQDRWGKAVPWYIMTSPLNHEATVAFFREKQFFGLAERDVMFFPQGVLPSFDINTGRILLAAKDQVATNPDGHGGSLRALWNSGAIADMQRRGIKHISYFQVDNPIVRVVDPVFLGLHAAATDSSAQMSSKMIPKAYAEEKLGLFCKCGGRTEVIEYSDLPMDLQRERLGGSTGPLRFLAGSIAVHIIGVEFVRRLNTDANFSLPYHRAEKKIPCIDPETGAPINPTSNNGVKLEQFVFDALPLCDKSVVLETNRIEEFAPIKNATGVDSVESCTQIQTQRAATWLEAAGVKVPRTPDGAPDCTIELSPRTAMEAADLRSVSLPRAIAPGSRISL